MRTTAFGSPRSNTSGTELSKQRSERLVSVISGSMSLMSLDDPPPPPGDDEGGGTNVIVITWPVSLSDLVLVDPQDVPDSGTFFLYQDQVNGDQPPPYPFNPFPQCPVYNLGVDGLFIVDDTGVIRPDPEPLPIPEPQGHDYGPGTLWLEITNASGGVADLILHGTEAGTNYTIESKQALSDGWKPEMVITGQQVKIGRRWKWL